MWYAQSLIMEIFWLLSFLDFNSRVIAFGQLFYPSSLTIKNNLVYVNEWGNHHVSVFDTKGTFLHCFGNVV